MARDGGEILYGWALWEWPRVFIEAEHHAVWLSEGRMLDVTPHVPPSTRVLFLPDPDRIYDFATERRLQNRRRSLDELPMATAWVEASFGSDHRAPDEAPEGGGGATLTLYRVSTSEDRR